MKLKPFLAVLALPFAISMAYADENADGPTFSYSGFGSAILTSNNSDAGQFARPNQEVGVYSTPKLGVDSNLGLQGTAKFNDWLSLTGQVLIRKNGTKEHGAELAWAFARAKVNDDVAVRVGRVGLPVFMISDYRNVGYTNTFIRPPIEMYTQVILESVDGIDGIYQKSFGDTTITAQAAFGVTSVNSAGHYTIDFSRLSGINLVAENGPFTLRFGRVDATLSVDDSTSLNTVVGGLTSLGFAAQAKSVAVKDTKASFTSIGASVDWQNFVGQVEIGKRKSDSLSVADTTAWYTLFGYRVGKFLPYFTHASSTQDSARSVAGLPTSGPAPLLALVGGANAFASASPIQTSNSLGVRWDFYKSAAFKLQIDRISPTGRGTFIAPPTTTSIEPATVVAAGIDFVF